MTKKRGFDMTGVQDDPRARRDRKAPKGKPGAAAGLRAWQQQREAALEARLAAYREAEQRRRPGAQHAGT